MGCCESSSSGYDFNLGKDDLKDLIIMDPKAPDDDTSVYKYVLKM